MIAVALILAYLLGSIPTGLILGKWIWHKDLRQYGSRNLGATNAWRVLGKQAGLLIFALDFLKGVLSVLIAQVLVGSPASMAMAGLFAVVGHTCSIFLGLKGGKGVSTGLGVVAVLMPTVTLIIFLAWLAIVLKTRYVSLGSIVAAILVPVIALVFGYNSAYVMFGLLTALLIVWRHEENLARLSKGTESKI